MPSELATEIVFSGKAQPGLTATDVNVDEVNAFWFMERDFEIDCFVYNIMEFTYCGR